MGNKIIRRVFVNKKNKQLSVSLSKKQLKASNPNIKFNEDLFVELKILKKPRTKNGKKNK